MTRPGPGKSTTDWFRIYVAWHIATDSTKLGWVFDDPMRTLALPGLLIAAAIATWFPRTAGAGIGALLAAKLFLVAMTFPNTANHAYVEVVVAALALGLATPVADPKRAAERGRQLAQIVFALVVSIYTIAGMQKLVHGCWHDGEYVAFEMLTSSGGFGLTLRTALGVVAGWFGASAPQSVSWPTGLAPTTIAMPDWMALGSVTIAWTFLVAEIAIPLAAAWPRTRRAGLPLLVGMQIAIAATAWELEFGFLALACLATTGDRPRLHFGLLLVAHTSWLALRHILALHY